MYKSLCIAVSLLLLTGCSIVDGETHNQYNDIPKADIVIDTENITRVSPSEQLSIHVLENGEPVDNADITLSMWAAKEAEVWSREFDVMHKSNGEYTAEVDIPREGLYLIKVNVESDSINATPTKYFTVGSLDMFEEVFLQEFSNDESIQTHSHH